MLHDFGLVWTDAAQGELRSLVVDEPEFLDDRWDAFLAAYVEHVCWHAEIEPPTWVFQNNRYLDAFWYPANDSPTLRVEATVHAPVPGFARDMA